MLSRRLFHDIDSAKNEMADAVMAQELSSPPETGEEALDILFHHGAAEVNVDVLNNFAGTDRIWKSISVILYSPYFTVGGKRCTCKTHKNFIELAVHFCEMRQLKLQRVTSIWNTNVLVMTVRQDGVQHMSW